MCISLAPEWAAPGWAGLDEHSRAEQHVRVRLPATELTRQDSSAQLRSPRADLTALLLPASVPDHDVRRRLSLVREHHRTRCTRRDQVPAKLLAEHSAAALHEHSIVVCSE